MKKVLFVLTSHEDLGSTGEKTGFWIEEFAAPYYKLTDNGVEITLASPKGGQPPIDPKSALPDFQTPATVRFNNDKETQAKLAKTSKLEIVNHADYDAVFYPGGHGPLWDLAEDKNSISIIQAFYNNNKPVSAVCHAPGIFKNTKNIDGTPLVKDKRVTGFTNTEEEAVKLTDIVPFLVEDMLQANGGIYSKVADWQPYAVEDGLLITGQNPASSELVAELLLKQLNNYIVNISPTNAMIHTEIIIDAPVSKVWKTLTDFAELKNWSTSLQAINGELKNGAKVEVEFNFGGQILKPTHHLFYSAGESFGWSDPIDVFNGLFDNHIYKVEAISNNQTLFTQTDVIIGQNDLVTPLEIANKLKPLYQEFNEGLKTRSEEK
jgi:putative intracellular protease/amidase